MALSTETVMYDVEDCKVYALTADNGSSLTYGSAIDVPGIAQVGVDPNIVTAELKGDGGKVLDRKGKTDRLNFSATYGRLSLPVLAAILGGSVANDAGPPETQTYSLPGDNELPYFKLGFQIVETEDDVLSLSCYLYKCKLTGGTLLTGETDSYGQPTLELEAIPTINDDSMIDVILYDTETALDS